MCISIRSEQNIFLAENLVNIWVRFWQQKHICMINRQISCIVNFVIGKAPWNAFKGCISYAAVSYLLLMYELVLKGCSQCRYNYFNIPIAAHRSVCLHETLFLICHQADLELLETNPISTDAMLSSLFYVIRNMNVLHANRRRAQ